MGPGDPLWDLACAETGVGHSTSECAAIGAAHTSLTRWALAPHHTGVVAAVVDHVARAVDHGPGR